MSEGLWISWKHRARWSVSLWWVKAKRLMLRWLVVLIPLLVIANTIYQCGAR